MAKRRRTKGRKSRGGKFPTGTLLILAGAGVALFFLLRKTANATQVQMPTPESIMRARLLGTVGSEAAMRTMTIDYMKGTAVDYKTHMLRYYWDGVAWQLPPIISSPVPGATVTTPTPESLMRTKLSLIVGESNMIKLRIDYVAGEAYDQKSNTLMYYWNGNTWVKPVLTGADTVSA